MTIAQPIAKPLQRPLLIRHKHITQTMQHTGMVRRDRLRTLEVIARTWPVVLLDVEVCGRHANPHLVRFATA